MEKAAVYAGFIKVRCCYMEICRGILINNFSKLNERLKPVWSELRSRLKMREQVQ